MNSDTRAGHSLREMEQEVEAEGREWMRRRLEEKLQAQVEKDGAIFPPERTKSAPSKKRTDAVAHQLRHGGAEGMARKKSR
jgi:uncharacterized protein YdaU (DUF1376 family)